MSSSEDPGHGDSLPGGNMDEEHGHDVASAVTPSRIPMWVHDMLEKVFHIRKRNSTIEVIHFYPYIMECFRNIKHSEFLSFYFNFN